MNWQSMESAPRDATDILLKTNIGIVSAWFQKGHWIEHHEFGREYDGDIWVCYDDEFTLEVEIGPNGEYHDHGCLGWMPIPID